ncbi:MAG TPA: hypothetical protein VJN18_07880 [Polyangiaceae bacterium]|nr:hypothetical protein [Polyangiaceae bacterium]
MKYSDSMQIGSPGDVYSLGAVLRFAAGGKLVAGGDNYSDVQVFSVPDLKPVFGSLSAARGPGVAFSRDGKSMVTSGPERYQIDGWQRVWPSATPSAAGDPSRSSAAKFNWAELAADETAVVASNCDWNDVVSDNLVCRTTLHSMVDGQLLASLPNELGMHPDVSEPGDWIVAGGYLYHLPSGMLRLLDARAGIARFTATNDIVAGLEDGSLVKYCVQMPVK